MSARAKGRTGWHWYHKSNVAPSQVEAAPCHTPRGLEEVHVGIWDNPVRTMDLGVWRSGRSSPIRSRRTRLPCPRRSREHFVLTTIALCIGRCTDVCTPGKLTYEQDSPSVLQGSAASQGRARPQTAPGSRRSLPLNSGVRGLSPGRSPDHFTPSRQSHGQWCDKCTPARAAEGASGWHTRDAKKAAMRT